MGRAVHHIAPGRAEVVFTWEAITHLSRRESAWPQVSASAQICSSLIDQVGTGCTLFERDYTPELALLPRSVIALQTMRVWGNGPGKAETGCMRKSVDSSVDNTDK